MLDHVSLPVSDLARSAAFYDAALSPLGHVRVWTAADAVGYGAVDGQDKFAIKATPLPVTPLGGGFHVAFAAADRRAVDAFFRAALASGGRDNGPPGLRPRYGPDYYAAFVVNPDGHRIEAVCHEPG